MGAPRHGFNGLIYVSGTEIAGANAWAVDIATDSVETPVFGDTWKKRVTGMNDWSGSLTVWDYADSRVLQDSATAQASVALLIYPTRADLADYYSGSAIFSFSSGGDTGSAVANTASFTGNDTLAITGFA
jgi:hypothetical protein